MKAIRVLVWPLLLAALALRGLTPTAHAADWPAFRGPNGSGVSEEKSFPIKWGPKEGLRWKAELPGRGLSNPVVAGGRVFVTACSGPKERRLHVLCFDEQTGKKLWERQFTATGSTMCHPKTNMAAPTPVTDGKVVYALFATGDLAALGHDGNLLWYRSLVGDYPNVTNQVGMAASLALAGKAVLVPLENAGDSFAAGIDRATGKNLWKVKRHVDINWVSPIVVTVGGKTSAVFQTGKETTAYDPDTGKVNWTFSADGLSTISSPAAGGGLVFVPGGELRALKPGPEGSTPEVVWTTTQLRSGYASPLYYKGRLYGLGGVAVTCVTADDGEVLWKQRVDGPVAASPVLGGGKIYQVNELGVTAVIDISGEKPKVLAANKLYEGEVSDRDRILATPALANGAIYLRSDRYLFCVGAKR
jgi:outer membrane protein assembly factor BamB